LKPTFNTSNKKQIYLTEQLFRSTYKYPFNYDEIVALLSCREPSKAIQQFLVSKNFLEFSFEKKAFMLQEGAWYSSHGKNPIITNLILLARYFTFSMLGIGLVVIAIGYINKQYIAGSESVGVYFILAIVAIIFSLRLFIQAGKDLYQTGNKKIADEFLTENFPKKGCSSVERS